MTAVVVVAAVLALAAGVLLLPRPQRSEPAAPARVGPLGRLWSWCPIENTFTPQYEDGRGRRCLSCQEDR